MYGNVPVWRRPQSDNEYCSSDGPQRREQTVPEVQAEIGAQVRQRRAWIRACLPMAGLRLRTHYDQAPVRHTKSTPRPSPAHPETTKATSYDCAMTNRPTSQKTVTAMTNSYEAGVVYDMRRVSTGSEVDFKRRYRIRGALSILRAWSVEPKKPDHAETCDRFPAKLDNVSFMYRERVCCMCGADRKPFEFPEWVTDEILIAAYECADKIQTASGDFNQREAARLHDEAIRSRNGLR